MSALRYAYNTNGLTHHGLDDLLVLLAENGYDGVALTLDHGRANPFAPGAEEELGRIGRRLRELRLACVIETGAFFLLDPRAKHQPTLVSPDAERRAVRVDFLRRAVRVAETLGAEAVPFFAGEAPPGTDAAAAWDQLVEGIAQMLPEARDRGVALAIEPEPLHVVEDAVSYLRLQAELPDLGIALDTGHAQVTGPPWPVEQVGLVAPHLRAASVSGMRTGVHEHLPFDEGDLDLPAVLAALRGAGYRNLVSAELSSSAGLADVLVPRVIRELRAAETEATSAPIVLPATVTVPSGAVG